LTSLNGSVKITMSCQVYLQLVDFVVLIDFSKGLIIFIVIIIILIHDLGVLIDWVLYIAC